MAKTGGFLKYVPQGADKRGSGKKYGRPTLKSLPGSGPRQAEG